MKQSNLGLTLAIVFASSIISGSLVYFGMNLSNNNLGSNMMGNRVAVDTNKGGTADNKAPTAPTTAPSKVDVPKPDANKDHILGEKNARFSLIEYSDFICPFCKKLHPTAQALVTQYKGQLNWVLRNFPLSIHEPLSTDTAIAAECVAKTSNNDAYWKFADSMMADQANQNRDAAYYGKMGMAAGADSSKVMDCFTKRETEKIVTDGVNEGMNVGVNGTPASYILDSKTGETFSISGAAPLAKFASIIDSQLKK